MSESRDETAEPCANDLHARCGCKPFGGLCPVVTPPQVARGERHADAAFASYDRAAAHYREFLSTPPAQTTGVTP